MYGLQLILLAYLCLENVLQWKGFADTVGEWERRPVGCLSILVLMQVGSPLLDSSLAPTLLGPRRFYVAKFLAWSTH